MPLWSRGISPELTADERAILAFGCDMMSAEGPAALSEPLARALGFEGAALAEAKFLELSGRIDRSDQLTATEWAQAMVGTEIAFISDLLGAASDWQAIRGADAVRDLDSIRSGQVRLWEAGVRYPLPKAVS